MSSFASENTRQRLNLLGVAAMLLLNFPLAFLADGTWHGFPVVGLYLFAVWALLIFAAYVSLKFPAHEQPHPASPSSPSSAANAPVPPASATSNPTAGSVEPERHQP